MNSTTAKPRTIPTEIASRLGSLRGQLLRWILVSGLSRWLIAILVVLAADMLLDRMFKMDFAQRLIMLLVMASFAIGYLVYRVVRPLRHRPGDDALLCQVESKNKQLREILISGSQLARHPNLDEQGVSRELAEATIQKSVAQAKSLDFGQTLNQPKFWTNFSV